MYRNAAFALSFTGLLHLVSVVDGGQAVDVTWVSPNKGDTFGPGDTIVGRWNAEKAVVSPSFRLCTAEDDSGDGKHKARRDSDEEGGGDDTCGKAVWPTIQRADDGSYMIHM